MDQLRLLLGKVNNSDTAMLEAAEKVSRANLEIKSSLISLIEKSTSRMIELGEKSVTLSVSSKYKPFFKEVLDVKYGKGRFYDFDIKDYEPSIIGIEYYIKMTIRMKEV